MSCRYYGPLDNLPEVQALVELYAGRLLLLPAQHDAQTASTQAIDMSASAACMTTVDGDWVMTLTDQLSSCSKDCNSTGAGYRGPLDQNSVMNWGQVPNQDEALKQQAHIEATAAVDRVVQSCHPDQQLNNVLPAGHLVGLAGVPSHLAGVAGHPITQHGHAAGGLQDDGGTSKRYIDSSFSIPLLSSSNNARERAAAAVRAIQTAAPCNPVVMSSGHSRSSIAAATNHTQRGLAPAGWAVLSGIDPVAANGSRWWSLGQASTSEQQQLQQRLSLLTGPARLPFVGSRMDSQQHSCSSEGTLGVHQMPSMRMDASILVPPEYVQVTYSA